MIAVAKPNPDKPVEAPKKQEAPKAVPKKTTKKSGK